MRKATVERKTNETEIFVEISLDGKGDYEVKTPVGFFNHMLECFAKHGLFDLKIYARGDINVDQHHTVEDCGIVIGKAFAKALGDKKGIKRSGYYVYPMDDSLAVVAVDIGGRPYLQYDVKLKRRYCGDLDTDLLEDFFQGFVMGAQANVAVRMPYGRNDHHKIEAIFKAFAKAMDMACALDPRSEGIIPSTKGVIEDDRNN